MSNTPLSALPLDWAADASIPAGQQPPTDWPAEHAAVPEQRSAPPTGEAASVIHRPTRTRAKRPMILVVDDEESIAELLAEFLASEGFRAKVARDGREALMCALRDRPALILSDWMMPGMDGTRFVWELRRRPATAHIPIVLMSSMRPDRRSLHDVPFLAKPFELDDVLDLVIRETRPPSLGNRLTGEG